MSYQVIARKYRPQRFEDVVGQEHVTQTLANAVRQNRIAHAYLFVGPRGTGKTTIARIFAKSLNCTNGPRVDFAADDPRCLEISEGRSLDVLEIDGASNRGIEEIRALRETVKYAPATSRFKIYIIDEVHMLTKEAFNALLKTLEEPPEHVKFMFATTEPEKVLPTILSRCQRYDLRRIPIALIVKHLGQIAQLEKVGVEEAALHAIARGADGCMRDAESALDQLISFCGDQIVEADVLSMFGLTARSEVQAMAGSILAADMEGALRSLNELAKNGKDLGRLLSDLLTHFRNLLLYQVGKGDLALLEVSESDAAFLQSQAQTVSTEALTQIMEVLSDCESRFRDAASKRILLEVAFLKAIQARGAVSIDYVLKQLQQLRGSGAVGAMKGSGESIQKSSPSSPPAMSSATLMDLPASSAPLVTAAPPTPAAPAPAEAKSAMASATVEPAGLGDLWVRIIEAVGRVSQFTRSYLLQAHPVTFQNQTFTIGFDPEFADHIDLVDNPKNRTLIQTKLRELGCGDLQVKFVKAEAPAERPPQSVPVVSPPPENVPEPVRQVANSATETKATKPAPVLLDKEDFKNDPLIKQALEIFKGQIIEVRA